MERQGRAGGGEGVGPNTKAPLPHEEDWEGLLSAFLERNRDSSVNIPDSFT